MKRNRKTSAFQPQFDRMLSMFPGEMRTPLIEFSKNISKIDADYLIFAARKGIRLYDLLTFSGAPPAKTRIYSDHILDQNLSFLEGKKVSIVDDTLILGSSLHRLRKRLVEAQVREVEIHILCAQEDAAIGAVAPTSLYATLTSQEMLTFCTSEVAAFAAFGLPYLTDFPISTIKKFRSSWLENLLSSSRWRAYTTTNPFQARGRSTGQTFLASNDVQRKAAQNILSDESIFEIAKVRLIGREYKHQFHYCRFIPIVTLVPMKRKETTDILVGALTRVDADAEYFLEQFESHVARTRLLQHIASVELYRNFCDDMAVYTHDGMFPDLDEDETARHFGHWVIPHFRKMSSSLATEYDVPSGARSHTWSTSKTKIPAAFQSLMNKDASAMLSLPRRRRIKGERPTIFADMMRLFVEFYKQVEIPARNEYKEAVARGVDNLEQLPLIDRLSIGFSWPAILKELVGSNVSSGQKQRLSVLLDCLIDTGIAVPILCERAGVVFRAYRHGEDVLFGEQEYALCHLALEAFMKGKNVEKVDHLSTEKLFSLLIKIGAKLQYLEEINGTAGQSEWARVGYYLHGAVTYYEPAAEGFLPESEESFLTSYLCDRKILKRSKSGHYVLGDRPEASERKRGSATFAREFGYLLGRIFNEELRSGVRNWDDSDLIILGTCTGTVDTVAAVAVELRLFSNIFFRKVLPLIRDVNWNSIDDISRAKTDLTSSNAYIAINSARLKIVAALEGKPGAIIEDTRREIETQTHDQLYMWRWEEYVGQLGEKLEIEEEDRLIGSLKITLGGALMDVALGVFCLELALASRLVDLQQKRYRSLFLKTCRKIDKFISALDRVNVEAEFGQSLHDRLREVCAEEKALTRYEAAYETGLAQMEAVGTKCVNSAHENLLDAFEIGRSLRTRKFTRFVWFDVVNSLAEKGNFSQDEKDKYRSRVKRFEKSINREIVRIQGEAIRNGCLIRGRPGVEEDTDDEKALFLSGAGVDRFLRECIYTIAFWASHYRVSVRVVGLNAGFTGVQPYQIEMDANIAARSFEEHFSRVKRRLEEYGLDSYERGPGGLGDRVVVWLGGALSQRTAVDARLESAEIFGPVNVRSDVAGNRVETPFSGHIVVPVRR